MITATHKRKLSNGEIVLLNELDQSVEDAFISLVKNELMFGGRVCESSDEHVTIETPIFSKIDYTTFRGSVEEMRPLLGFCLLWSTEDVTDEDVDDVLNVTKGIPLYVTTIGPHIVGRNKLDRIIQEVRRTS